MVKTKNRAKEIAKLQDFIPKDLDPEEDVSAQDSEEESGSESDDGLIGTEHYVEVGKSKLRKPEEVSLGPQYAGSRITREQLTNGDDEDGDEEEDNDDDAENGDEDAGSDSEPIDVFMDMEVDSDEAFGESDEEKYKDFVFRASSKPNKTKKPVDVNGSKKRPTAADFMSDSEEEGAKLEGEDDDSDDDAEVDQNEEDETDEDILDVEVQHSEGMDEIELNSEDQDIESSNPDQSGAEEEDTDEDSEDGSEDEDEQARRAELRKIMGEEQKSEVATISQAAKADADKGNAVKQQRKAFDSLLNVRIRLQKALVATNSLPMVEDKEQDDAEGKPFQAAEEAAIKLWNTIDGLRHSLSKASNPETASKKRKRAVDSDTPSSTIWERMQATELTVLNNRQSVLEKWSSKVRATNAIPISRKLVSSAPQQSITSLLQDTLASSTHLISRTQVPRSCAPIQARQKLTTAPSIFDDADFYQLLLKELLDQRMIDSSNTNGAGSGTAQPLKQWTAVKEAKTRKNVDTKASKGRKMKFTVHEKLQNFMAPEDRGSWEESARDRFFATLLGRKMDLVEDEAGSDDGEDGLKEDEALMLFRS